MFRAIGARMFSLYSATRSLARSLRLSQFFIDNYSPQENVDVRTHNGIQIDGHISDCCSSLVSRLVSVRLALLERRRLIVLPYPR